jgi:hypothetical protein
MAGQSILSLLYPPARIIGEAISPLNNSRSKVLSFDNLKGAFCETLCYPEIEMLSKLKGFYGLTTCGNPTVQPFSIVQN